MFRLVSTYESKGDANASSFDISPKKRIESVLFGNFEFSVGWNICAGETEINKTTDWALVQNAALIGVVINLC